MAFPKTWDALKESGYIWTGDGECKGCGDPIMWFRTPNGKNMPVNQMSRGTDEVVPHWAVCPEQDSFRKKD